MDEAILNGARIIMRDWVRVHWYDRVLLVSSAKYMREVEAMQAAAQEAGAKAETLMLDDLAQYVGTYFDDRENAFDPYSVIIGATEYSLVTTKAVRRAVRKHKKFLSLPLSTNNGVSMLSYDFLAMDTRRSRNMAKVIMGYLNASNKIEVKTAAGTHLKCKMRGRKAGFFNGCCRDGHGFSSASIEVYIPIEETETEGTIVLDGSMGYIGIVSEPVHITLGGGRIVSIEQNESGKKLAEYIQTYQDPEMYVAAEFGIGLNTHSHCEGNCYIEDESTYGTFHIGFGRNFALGGVHDAKGHFDLVTHAPDIYVDNVLIMQQGKITIREYR